MKSRQIADESMPAYYTPIEDPQVRFYMQARVLAGPEDPALFRPAVEAFRDCFSERQNPPAATNLGQIIELEDDEAEPSPAFRKAVEDQFAALHHNNREEERRNSMGYWGWKVARLGDDHSRILSIGCAHGEELIYLRARYPNASITALDYPSDSPLREEIVARVGCRFIAGDIFETVSSLTSRGERYDLVFSHHVVEHFFDPDKQIGEIARLLSAGGVFCAGLPLDAYPYCDLLAKIGGRKDLLHPLDLNWLDPRHPWKTNEKDLAATLKNASLEDVRIYQRRNHASARLRKTLEGCRRRERYGRLMYALFLSFPIAVLKSFSKNPPRRLARLVFALDRRLWFGRYRLKCEVQPEVCVTAVRL